MGQGPLEGLTVLDISTVIGGPMAASLLGEYGASVIKIEHPLYGDGSRQAGTTKAARGLWWKFLSRNKKCVTLNLSKAEGADVFRQMVAEADVVVENFRPGTLEKWGLGPSDLAKVNRGLVMLRVTGFGQDGPYSGRPGYGTIAEAMSGFAHMTGQPDGPPTLPGIPLADGLVGLTGAAAVMFAIWSRDCGPGKGRGDVIDLSLYNPLLYILGLFVAEYDHTGVINQRRGNRFGQAPRNARLCTDGTWVAYAAMTPVMLDSIVDFLGLRQDSRFETLGAGLEHGEDLDALLGTWVEAHTSEEVVNALAGINIPVSYVYDTEGIVKDEHVRARGDIVDVPDHELGTLAMPVGPARFANRPGGVAFTGGAKGADNNEVFLEWLGMSADKLEQLRDRKVV